MLSALQGLVHWAPLGLPAFLLLITPIVFFHELGHYAVARAFGVKIETFSIGFGRELIGWTAKSGTRWKISMIPLGGYVKFFGDADAASTPDRENARIMRAKDRAQALQFKPLWQRALVVVAGPVANFILALVLLTGFFMAVGHVATPLVVGGVQPGSAAASAGIRPGDHIIALDGENITSFEELEPLVSINGGYRMPMRLVRAGHVLTLWVTPRIVTDHDQFKNRQRVGRLGITSLRNAAVFERLGPLRALGAAVDEIHLVLATSLMARRNLFSGDASQLSGVVGIAHLSQQVASVSFLSLIELAAFISVSVGLINLFPIPLLDGGHLLYYACEAVLGRPLGERAQDVGFRLGLAFVLGLFLLATWNDLIRLNLF
ncbi:MAG TPA: M50 family metallopeptidase [Rhizomicrobium sp.]